MTNAETNRKHGNLLFRSRTEIRRILLALAQEKCRISAELAGERGFASHLLGVDPKAGYLTIAYSPSKLINALLLETPSVEFTATNSKEVNFSFEASNLEEALFDGQPAIRCPLPKVLLLHERREHKRVRVPAEVSLRCVADEQGVIPFESRITDISREGLGCLVYGPEIQIEDGTVLHGCRIVLPSGDAVITDIELRHATTVTLANGTAVKAAGFRFPQQTAELARALEHFIEPLGQ